MRAVGDDPRQLVQFEQLHRLLRTALERDSFSARTLRASGIEAADDVHGLEQLPLLTRAELVEDQARHPPFGTRSTLSSDHYVAARSTRGTSGTPLRWLDTAEALTQRAATWEHLLAKLGVTARDTMLVALPSAALAEDCLAGARRIGALSIVADDNGLRSDANTYAPNVVVCMPSQAQRLQRAVRLLVLCGEPGGHVPEFRRRLEHRLEARCADVYAMGEVGIAAADCSIGRMHVVANLLAEVIDGELMLTDLHSVHAPLVRYCTRDVVDGAVVETCRCGTTALTLPSGVLGRREDELVVRGQRVLPSVIQNVARRHPAVVDLRLRIYGQRENCQVMLELEPESAIASEGDRSRVAAEVSEDLRRSLGLRIVCEVLVPGTLSDQALGRRARKLRRQ